MSTPNIEPQQQFTAVAATSPLDRALALLREALEQQRLCDSSLDVEGLIAFAVAHPDQEVVDSFASAEVMSAMDEVFGTALPKEILNHRSLSTLSGLQRSIAVLEARNRKKPPQRRS